MSVSMHSGGPHPADQQAFFGAAEEKAEGVSAGRKAAADKASPRGPAESSAKPEAAGGPPLASSEVPGGSKSASATASASAADSGGGADVTSASEAVDGAEERSGESSGEDVGAVVTADKSRVTISVAEEASGAKLEDEEAEEFGDSVDGNGEEDINDGAIDKDLRVGENGCPPEEIPDDLIPEYNNGILIMRV